MIDAGKAIAGLLTNPGDVLDYLEVVGGGKPLESPAVPFLAIPTTAGTGTEATRNAVLDVPRAWGEGEPAERLTCFPAWPSSILS